MNRLDPYVISHTVMVSIYADNKYNLKHNSKYIIKTIFILNNFLSFKKKKTHTHTYTHIDGCFANTTINSSKNLPCSSHGTCEMGDVGTFCKCHTGYTGTFCEHSKLCFFFFVSILLCMVRTLLKFLWIFFLFLFFWFFIIFDLMLYMSINKLEVVVLL